MTERNGGSVPVALYDRLSTAAQAEEGHAAEGHLRELREEMARTGRAVVEEVREAGEKRFMYSRPGVSRLMELAQAGRIREVWAWSWQRYGEGSVPQRIEEDLADLGVTLRALDDGGEGLGGEILRAVGGVLSANDQRERVRKAGMGKRSKARGGMPVGVGRRPRYGFAHVRNEKGKVVGCDPVAGEMKVVRRVLGALASGASIHSVQAMLEADGVTAPMGGGRWGRETIRKMALADCYRPHSPEELRGLVAEGLLSEEVHDALDPGGTYGIEYYGKTRSRRASRHTKRRVAEPAPRSSWVAIPVSLDGGGTDAGFASTADAARRNVEGNRKGSKAGSREWELSGGLLHCSECSRSMQAVVTNNGRGRIYHYYVCSGFRDARSAAARASRCQNSRNHPAARLEFRAAGLFEDNASHDALLGLYEEAVRREEERLGIGDADAAGETHGRLSGELETLAAERRGYLRQNARGAIPDGELDDLLSETDARREDLARRLREAEAAMNARKSLAPAWSPVHAEWYEDPDAIQPGEVLTHATSPEDVRAAYRRHRARFEVDPEGGLSMRMEVPLEVRDAPVSGLTTIRR